ncbi:MAG: LysM peptidoglycan-binding domain-containing protein [Gemmatimonadetes bacterium]|nr:LysM peptidoglycan-binding domain-containing protein [Gemmatimonadota bacterium]
MTGRRYLHALGLGALVLTLALLTAWAISRRAPAAQEPTPVEAILEELGEVELPEPRWDVPVTYNARVEQWLDFLAGRNREKTELWLERSGRYAPMIGGKLRERGMPEDLVYLALIESGFSPRAYSRARASGIWQFIAETARRYGLVVDDQVDERRDPLASTDAALDYLQELYARFGSWYLAAAAYNTGENRVARLLREHAGGAAGDDALFWRIAPYLPEEARNYVPLMLAAGHIGKDPVRYGFHELEYQLPLAFDTVQVPGGTHLETVARAAGVDESEVKELNPHLIAGVAPAGELQAVRIPSGRRQVFAQTFARVYRETQLALERREAEAKRVRLATAHHTVRRGETLWGIARRYGISVRALQAANGGVRPERLRAGRRLHVPGASTRTAGADWTIYRVRRGDTLWDVARRYDVSIRQLQSWNELGGSRILPGQRLRVRT